MVSLNFSSSLFWVSVMTNFRIPNASSSLNETPELARLVGVYMSTFSMVEFSSLQLFAHLMKCHSHIAHIILHEFLNFRSRINVISDLSKVLIGDAATLAKIEDIAARLGSANSYRNKIAHSIYALGEKTDDMWLIANATKKNAKPKATEITEAELKAEIQVLETLIVDIEPFWADQLPSPGAP
jgi:hypothetical protein